jgi:ligand-binding sensor domain-containing protein/signal transduction histidine kinase
MTTRPIWLTLSVLSFAGCFASCTSSARALDLPEQITLYAHRTWTVREGFTKGPVHAITQTMDGYLWLGTTAGLVRFDGIRAVPWLPPEGPRLPSPVILSLLDGHDGTLWIGTLRGLVSWKSGRATTYEQLAGLNVASLTEGPNGTVWASGYSFDSNGKLCSIRAGQLRCDSDRRLGHGALGVHVDRSGTLWIAAVGGFWRWAPGTPQFYPVSDKSSSYQDFAEDGSGALLIPLLGRMGRVNAGVFETAYAYPSRVREAHGNRILRDRDGADWIGTVSHGLIRAQGDARETFASANGLTGDVIVAIFEDREGNIWVSTDKGLDRFSANSVATFSEREGLATPLFSLVAARDGSIWITAPGRIYRIQNGQATLYRAPDARSNPMSPEIVRASGEVVVHDLPQYDAASLFEDAHGRIWVVGPDLAGYLQDRLFVPSRSVPRGTVYATAGDPAGNVWISYLEHGLVHVFEDNLQEVLPWSAFGDNGLATALAMDPKDESVWIGFSKGGIAALSRDHLRRSFTASDGLGPGRVSDLRFDGDDALWVATDGGLSRLKHGHFDTITSNNGLPCNRLFWSERADDHSLWLYGECGLIHVASAELEAWIAGKTQKLRTTLLDASDGVSLFAADLSQVISPKAAISADGRIWFRTYAGLSVIRPRRLAVNPVAPPVHIERMTADGLTYDLSRTVRLPARIRDLAIEYTALSFVAPEKMQFRYRLQGQDSDWREAVNDRRVQYSNLAPGNYRFQVLASNNSGVWNERGATLDFSIAPAYWQTLWFRAACAVALAVGLWLLYQVRLRQTARGFERTLDARVAERTRIARELHDTLLQSFHGLLLQFQAVSRLFTLRPAEAKQLLDGAIDQAAKAITEGRDAVEDLRSSIEEPNNLAAAIGKLAEDLSAGKAQAQAAEGSPARPVDIHLSIDGVTKSLHPIVRDEVYRIAAEALRNAVQHSLGTQIEVELYYGPRALRLRVYDDGAGIDTKVVAAGDREGHFGLRGMRERAEVAGGKLTVWSAQGVGTEVDFTVPASRAYVRTRVPGRADSEASTD